MKIGVIGWYGHNNAGDQRILYSIQRYFSNCEFFVIDINTAPNHIREINTCNLVIFGGGGLILRGFNIYADLINSIKVPFVSIGISVEARHDDNINFIKAIEYKSEFIVVRDTQSAKLLDEQSKVIVAPDLTFLYPYEIVNPTEKDIWGLNLRHWYYWKSEHGSINHRVLVKLNKYFPWIKHLYFPPKWEPKYPVQILKSNVTELRPISLYGEITKNNDIQILSQFFETIDIDNDFSDQLIDCRYFVSMRLHGLIFACQMGLPFISLSYQPKNYGFLEELGLRDLSVDIFKSEELENKIDLLRENYKDIRERLIYFRNESNLKIHQTMDYLSKEMNL
ncbi:polysaccharide pyruvyl transferase CsaB [Mycobacteroides abscessus subsp. abscessus]|nr:polysaccharide pyruvyl transferase CsaB [Mycobacteroides abscessus subsp. abscessus]